MRSTIRTTCPRDCYDACGVLVALDDGRVRHVRGDPAHPISRGKLCRKCSIGYNGVFLDEAARLTRPLVRSGPKGSGAFSETTWDDALARCAAGLRAAIDGHGAHTVLNAHYTGTLSLLATAFGQRLMGRLGATEVDGDSVCNKAGHVALGYVYGDSELGFDPRTARDAACIVVWGANPSACGPHQDEHWLAESGATVVAIDPLQTDTAARAHVHLQLRPGTDAVLAFALLHVAWRDGLLDRDFVDRHVIGLDELEPHVRACTPAHAADVCGLEAAAIEEVGRLYARGPSLLWLGQGLQRQPRGGNVFRAVAALPALTGNIGRPGAGFLYLNGWDRVGIDGDLLTAAHLAVDERPPVSQMDLAAILEDPSRSRALVLWNINVASSNPDQARLRAALAREDLFCIALDLFPTDSTRMADVVLPAASFLEFDDLVVPYFDLAIAAQVKAVDPPGEALPNSEIFRRLAAALGLDEPELHEPDRAVIDALLAASRFGVTWDELVARGTVPLPGPPELQWPDGAFPTPSGRIELASAQAEADGHPRVPQPTADPPPAGDRLRLLSPASPWLMNGTFGNDPKIRRRLGEATVALHPDDAAARGLAAGDRATLRSDAGALALAVELSRRVPRGVALVPKGRWPGGEPGGVNVNVLHAGRKADMGESTAVHGVEVTVTPA